MEYCPHCLAPNVSGKFCKKCGGALDQPQAHNGLPVGTVLNSGDGRRHYWIGAAKYSDGFSITYNAIETGSQRPVTIKECVAGGACRGPDGITMKPFPGVEQKFQEGLKRFFAETSKSSTVGDLPSMPRVLDGIQANGTAYAVLEYLNGVSLLDEMNAPGGRMPAQVLLQKMGPVLRDLNALHQRRILLHNFDPKEMMQMPDGSIKLLGYGITRDRRDEDNMDLIPEMAYSPIEVYSNKGFGPWTDIYRLAASLYHCITGVKPPAADARLERDELRSPRELGADITVPQENALLWALSLQPTARPQSAEAFYRALFAPAPAQQAAPQQIAPTQPAPPPQEPDQFGQTEQPGHTVLLSQPEQPGNGGQVPQATPPKKKRIFIPILIGVLAILVIIGGVVAFFFLRGTGDKAEPTATPSGTLEAQTSTEPSEAPAESTAPQETPSAEPTPETTPEPTPEPTPAPTPEPTANVETGTLNGYTYEIVDGKYASLTGYTESNLDDMPTDIDGVLVREIADNAFAGASFDADVDLPQRLGRIGSGAFQGATGLRFLIAYSSFTMEPDSFQNCSMKAVILFDQAAFLDWPETDGVRAFRIGTETPVGRVKAFFYDDARTVLYASTDEDKGVFLEALDISGGLTIVGTLNASDGTEYPVEWVDEHALDRVSKLEIQLPDSCLFNPELYPKADWEAPENSLTDMWLLTNYYAQRVNAARPSGAAQIVPDYETMMAAWVRAEECAELYDSTRPDGRLGFTALSDRGIAYEYAYYVSSKSAPRSSSLVSYVQDCYEDPISEEEWPSRAGQYYTHIGAAYYTEDGKTACYFFAYVE